MASFSEALDAMKAGKRVRRPVWNGTTSQPLGAHAEIREIAGYEPQIMVTSPADGITRPFSGGQWDILAEDWEILS